MSRSLNVIIGLSVAMAVVISGFVIMAEADGSIAPTPVTEPDITPIPQPATTPTAQPLVTPTPEPPSAGTITVVVDCPDDIADRVNVDSYNIEGYRYKYNYRNNNHYTFEGLPYDQYLVFVTCSFNDGTPFSEQRAVTVGPDKVEFLVSIDPPRKDPPPPAIVAPDITPAANPAVPSPPAPGHDDNSTPIPTSSPIPTSLAIPGASPSAVHDTRPAAYPIVIPGTMPVPDIATTMAPAILTTPDPGISPAPVANATAGLTHMPDVTPAPAQQQDSTEADPVNTADDILHDPGIIVLCAGCAIIVVLMSFIVFRNL